VSWEHHLHGRVRALTFRVGDVQPMQAVTMSVFLIGFSYGVFDHLFNSFECLTEDIKHSFERICQLVRQFMV
jgi:hypothetical protein